MSAKKFDLLLTDNRVITWTGATGEDAAIRYVDCKGGTVTAWRERREPQILPLGRDLPLYCNS